jgi:hypothetical protein
MLYPSKVLLVFISVRDWANPRAMVRLEGFPSFYQSASTIYATAPTEIKNTCLKIVKQENYTKFWKRTSLGKRQLDKPGSREWHWARNLFGSKPVWISRIWPNGGLTYWRVSCSLRSQQDLPRNVLPRVHARRPRLSQSHQLGENWKHAMTEAEVAIGWTWSRAKSNCTTRLWG